MLGEQYELSPEQSAGLMPQLAHRAHAPGEGLAEPLFSYLNGTCDPQTDLLQSPILCVWAGRDPKSRSGAWLVFATSGPPVMAHGGTWAGTSSKCGERIESLEKESCFVLAPATRALSLQSTSRAIGAHHRTGPSLSLPPPITSPPAPASAGALGPRPPFLRAPPQTSPSLKTAPSPPPHDIFSSLSHHS